MFGTSTYLGNDPSSPPFGSNMFSQTSQQDSFLQNRNDNFNKQSSNFILGKDMSFSKNFEDDNENVGSGYFKKGNDSINEGQNNDTLFNMFSQNKPSALNNNSNIEVQQQQRQKTLSFQGNDSEQFGSGFSYSNNNESSIPFPPAQPKRNTKSKISQNIQKDSGGEDDIKGSPRQISPTHQNMLRRSLEQLTPHIIDQGLKQLRQMNETRQTKPLASPSVIFNHCIDEEEIVQNIRGLARELKNIGQMEKDLEVELKEKLEDKLEIIIKKKKNNEVFTKLHRDHFEKQEKQMHLQLEKEREIEVMQNISAVNKRSEQILQEKKNYVKIHERVDTIIQRKQMKVDHALYQKKMEENAIMQKNPFQNKNQHANLNQLHQTIQNTGLDYSQSTENNGQNNLNPQRYSEKSFTLSQLEFNPANAYQNSNNYNKGYTKKQLDDFLERNEKRKQIVHDQILEKKLQKEQLEMTSATFHPRINKKSEQIAQSTWEPIEERIEKMQEKMIEKRKKQCENEFTKYSYSPLINRKSNQLASKLNRTPLNKSYNNLNRSISPFNKSFNQTQDLSTSRNLNSSRKNNENFGQASRPISAALSKSKNQSSTQINQKNFQKNDSTYNIQVFKDRNNSINKMGTTPSQIKISQFGINDNQNTMLKSEKVNLSDLQKEDYLLNFTQQYMLNKDQNQKLNTQGSMQSTLSKSSSNNMLIADFNKQQHQQQYQQDQQKSPILSASQQLKKRSISSISINKQNEPKSPNLISKQNEQKSPYLMSKKVNIVNPQAKAIPLNKDNKFILNLMNKKK